MHAHVGHATLLLGFIRGSSDNGNIRALFFLRKRNEAEDIDMAAVAREGLKKGHVPLLFMSVSEPKASGAAPSGATTTTTDSE